MEFKIAAIATVHNRKEKTLRSVNTLLESAKYAGRKIDFYIVDDGSTDGTRRALSERFPEVKVIQGDGNLFWNRGMRLGISVAKQFGYDFYILFNDDVVFYQCALKILFTQLDSEDESLKIGREDVIVGAVADPVTGITAYGGKSHNSWWHPLRFETVIPDGSFKICDTLNMNCALVPEKVLAELENLDKKFTHAGGDFDFGLRAVQKGFRILSTPDHIGECERNYRNKNSVNSLRGYIELFSTKQEPIRERLVYYRRHGGHFWFIFWLAPYFTYWIKRAFRGCNNEIFKKST